MSYTQVHSFFIVFRVKYPLRPIRGIVLYAGIYGSYVFSYSFVSCFQLLASVLGQGIITPEGIAVEAAAEWCSSLLMSDFSLQHYRYK